MGEQYAGNIPGMRCELWGLVLLQLDQQQPVEEVLWLVERNQICTESLKMLFVDHCMGGPTMSHRAQPRGTEPRSLPSLTIGSGRCLRLTTSALGPTQIA